jgi:glycolate oxidase
LKLLPLPPLRACLAVGFGSMRDAARALGGCVCGRFLPSALRLPTHSRWRRRSGGQAAGFWRAVGPFDRGVGWSCRFGPIRVAGVGDGCCGVSTGDAAARVGAAGCERFWQLRREFSYALRDTGLDQANEDVVVPRGRLEDLFRFTATACSGRHGLPDCLLWSCGGWQYSCQPDGDPLGILNPGKFL